MKEKVEGTNTSYDPDHKDIYAFASKMEGNTEVANVERLNTGGSPGHMIFC